jgi:hypothetical protein
MFFAERATRSAPRRSMLLNVVKAKRHESDLTPQLLADIGVKGIKVDPDQLVNTDATSERIVGMAA